MTKCTHSYRLSLRQTPLYPALDYCTRVQCHYLRHFFYKATPHPYFDGKAVRREKVVMFERSLYTPTCEYCWYKRPRSTSHTQKLVRLWLAVVDILYRQKSQVGLLIMGSLEIYLQN